MDPFCLDVNISESNVCFYCEMKNNILYIHLGSLNFIVHSCAWCVNKPFFYFDIFGSKNLLVPEAI